MTTFFVAYALFFCILACIFAGAPFLLSLFDCFTRWYDALLSLEVVFEEREEWTPEPWAEWLLATPDISKCDATGVACTTQPSALSTCARTPLARTPLDEDKTLKQILKAFAPKAFDLTGEFLRTPHALELLASAALRAPYSWGHYGASPQIISQGMQIVRWYSPPPVKNLQLSA